MLTNNNTNSCSNNSRKSPLNGIFSSLSYNSVTMWSSSDTNNNTAGVMPFQSGLMLKKRILEAVHSVYRDAEYDNGNDWGTADEETNNSTSSPMSLPRIGSAVGVHVSEAARKATVMVIGNVSAGKSTL
eukprot:GHVS01091438.1.p1 GENE.GHVS01091438.1~~GHVS01091438.1.p1  ORF type:complete len:129 (+),score=36.09 GHVS01091438.1:160-546(+)